MMSQTRFVKFVKGRYCVTLTKTAEHPYKVFQDRHEAKVWLVEHGLQRPDAENCLLEAFAGTSPPRVLLSAGLAFSLNAPFRGRSLVRPPLHPATTNRLRDKTVSPPQ